MKNIEIFHKILFKTIHGMCAFECLSVKNITIGTTIPFKIRYIRILLATNERGIEKISDKGTIQNAMAFILLCFIREYKNHLHKLNSNKKDNNGTSYYNFTKGTYNYL